MTPNVLLLVARLGIEVAEGDRAAFCDAIERLFEQASLVMTLTGCLDLPDLLPGRFEP